MSEVLYIPPKQDPPHPLNSSDQVQIAKPSEPPVPVPKLISGTVAFQPDPTAWFDYSLYSSLKDKDRVDQNQYRDGVDQNQYGDQKLFVGPNSGFLSAANVCDTNPVYGSNDSRFKLGAQGFGTSPFDIDAQYPMSTVKETSSWPVLQARREGTCPKPAQLLKVKRSRPALVPTALSKTFESSKRSGRSRRMSGYKKKGLTYPETAKKNCVAYTAVKANTSGVVKRPKKVKEKKIAKFKLACTANKSVQVGMADQLDIEARKLELPPVDYGKTPVAHATLDIEEAAVSEPYGPTNWSPFKPSFSNNLSQAATHARTLSALLQNLRKAAGKEQNAEVQCILNQIETTTAMFVPGVKGAVDLETEFSLALQPMRSENAHLRRSVVF